MHGKRLFLKGAYISLTLLFTLISKNNAELPPTDLKTFLDSFDHCTNFLTGELAESSKSVEFILSQCALQPCFITYHFNPRAGVLVANQRSASPCSVQYIFSSAVSIYKSLVYVEPKPKYVLLVNPNPQQIEEQVQKSYPLFSSIVLMLLIDQMSIVNVQMFHTTCINPKAKYQTILTDPLEIYLNQQPLSIKIIHQIWTKIHLSFNQVDWTFQRRFSYVLSRTDLKEYVIGVILRKYNCTTLCCISIMKDFRIIIINPDMMLDPRHKTVHIPYGAIQREMRISIFATDEDDDHYIKNAPSIDYRMYVVLSRAIHGLNMSAVLIVVVILVIIFSSLAPRATKKPSPTSETSSQHSFVSLGSLRKVILWIFILLHLRIFYGGLMYYCKLRPTAGIKIVPIFSYSLEELLLKQDIYLVDNLMIVLDERFRYFTRKYINNNFLTKWYPQLLLDKKKVTKIFTKIVPIDYIKSNRHSITSGSPVPTCIRNTLCLDALNKSHGFEFLVSAECRTCIDVNNLSPTQQSQVKAVHSFAKPLSKIMFLRYSCPSPDKTLKNGIDYVESLFSSRSSATVITSWIIVDKVNFMWVHIGENFLTHKIIDNLAGMVESGMYFRALSFAGNPRNSKSQNFNPETKIKAIIKPLSTHTLRIAWIFPLTYLVVGVLSFLMELMYRGMEEQASAPNVKGNISVTPRNKTITSTGEYDGKTGEVTHSHPTDGIECANEAEDIGIPQYHHHIHDML
ncbi:unnamed protein product [Orchesella dallaii]|uniref:Uncharacterized protein n=1 Tax=Orchesella dallaii TaxID=48710 RepID=A0ABP1RZJ3_9HEXA